VEGEGTKRDTDLEPLKLYSKVQNPTVSTTSKTVLLQSTAQRTFFDFLLTGIVVSRRTVFNSWLTGIVVAFFTFVGSLGMSFSADDSTMSVTANVLSDDVLLLWLQNVFLLLAWLLLSNLIFFLAEGADWDTSLFTKVIVSAVN
jgi:hypothetical protein